MLCLDPSGLGFLLSLLALYGSYKVAQNQEGHKKPLPRDCTSLLGALLSTLSMGARSK